MGLVRRIGLALVLALCAGPAVAQAPRPAGDEPSGVTFLTPFPENDVYRVQVFGDPFAEGLTAGLADILGSDSRLQVVRKHRPIGALVRTEWEDDIKADEAARDQPHVAVIMLGLFDRQVLRVAGAPRPLAIGSDEWRAEYGRRLDRLVQSLRKRRIGVYVVGQPILRSAAESSRAEMLSEVMRQRAQANGAKFVDIFEAFQEDGGGYAQWGPDIAGNRQKLREADGVLFTLAGNRKIAHFVERELRRDIDQAVQDRAIPLAGDETEQKRLSPARASAAAQPGAWKGSVTVAQPKSPAAAAGAPLQPGDAGADQKADNVKVTFRAAGPQGREENVTLEIVRPPLSAAVIALVTRREATMAGRGVQPGEAVTEDIGAGQTVVNSVSMLGDGNQQVGRRRALSQQSPYVTVVIKGERLPPRPGRADDFAWPRNDAPTPAAAAAPPTTPPAQQRTPGRPEPRPRG